MTVPTFEPIGQRTGSRVPMPICLGVHASRPCAADGLSVIPSGSVTVALSSCEESISLGPLACGSFSSVVTPSGWSDWVVSGVSENSGLNGTSAKGAAPLQPSVPIGVVYFFEASWPSSERSVTVLVVAGPGPAQLLGLVMNPPCSVLPMSPLSSSREEISGSLGETFIS